MKYRIHYNKQIRIICFLLMFILCMLVFKTGYGQYIYSSNPAIGQWVQCPASCDTWIGGTVQIKVKSVNAASFTFTIKKCDGSAFTSSGTFRVGWDTDMQCNNLGAALGSTTISAGSYEKDITVPASWSGNNSYWVGVYTNSNNSYYAGFVTITRTPETPTSPNPPANVYSSLSGTSINVSWSSSSGADRYKVYMSTNGSGYNFMSTQYGTSYVFTTGQEGSTYCWKIAACNGSNCSSLSSAYSCTSIPTSSPCYEPHSLSVNPSTTSAIISWGSSSTATDYEVKYRQVGYSSWTTSFSSSTSFNLTSLVNNTSYEVQVRSRCPNNNYSGYVSTTFTTVSATKVINLSGNLSFGNVTVGSSSSLTLIISNTGNTQLYVSSISLPTAFTANWSSGYIASGGNRNVTITFTPSSSGGYSGNIVVNSDATSGNNSIVCSGNGASLANLELANNIVSIPNPLIQGQGKTVTFSVRNTGGTTFSGTIKLLFCNSSGIPIAVMEEVFSETITAGQTKNYTHNNSNTTAAAGVYKMRVDFSTNTNWLGYTGGSPVSAGQFSNPISIEVVAANVPTTPSNPNPPSGAADVATSPTLSWSSSLSGGTVSHDLYLSTSSTFASNNTLYSGGGTTQTISGLSNNTTYYWKVISYGSNGTTSSWSPVWSFTTSAIPSYCNFADCSSATNCGSTNYQETSYNAIQYLCSQNVVTGNNGSVYPDALITRAQLSKIALYGVFGDSANVPTQLVSDYFPSPYADLQNPNTYYYRAAKALLYLEFGDGVTPFDRNRFYFNPDGNIERNLVLKVLLETFNIAPDNSGPSPFSDYPSTAPHYGYAKKAHSLGITTTTAFRPYEYCTRAEAFIFLYRIMTKSPSLFPTINNTVDPQTSSFYIPFNISIANMNANMGIETGNFNHYTKSCFAIPGRNVSLDFDFTYNSYISELPTELYPLNPLSTAWSHTYNMYMNFIYGPTVYDTKFAIHMPDGSLLIYGLDANNNIVPETEGNYSTLTNVSSSKYEFKTKSHIVYTFQKLGTSDIAFVLTSIKDRNNNSVTLSYVQGENYTLPGTNTVRTTRKLSSVTDPAGRTLQFTYHAGTNLLSTITDPLSRVIRFNYTGGKLSTFTDAKNQNTTYNYGVAPHNMGLLVSIQLPKGNVINNQYHQRKLTSTRYNSNSPTTIAHNPNYVAGNNNFYKSSVTVPQQSGQSITTNYEMNKKGNITKADGNSAVNMSSAYNNASHSTLPSSITNNLNSVTVTPTYDQYGNVTQITTSAGGITTTETFQYNTFNDVTQHTNANNQTTYYYYNSNGNLIKVKDALHNETTVVNNNYGQPTSITNPSGITVNFGYNSYGNQNQVSIPSLGLSSSMEYDAASRMISTTNFSGQTNIYTYDNNDNLLTEKNALNHTISYAYDQNDNLTGITNAKGYATTFSYDNVTDWLLTESFQGATKTYTYNNDGSINTFRYPNGNTLTFVYDNAGRVTNDGYAAYTYLSNGNLSTITKDNKAITFGYDALNRVTSVTYDGSTINYTYDNLGNMLTMTYPGNKIVTYTYDAVNNLKTVKDWNNNTTTYHYRPDGQLDNMVYPNGVKTTYSYDNSGRPTGISTKRNNGSGSAIAEYSFVLDPVGNHTQESIIEQYTSYPAIPSQTINYTYNNANRIQTAGNTSFGFDNNGNTTSKTGYTLGYDVLNNLTSVSGSFNASFVYDGAGNRRQATRNGTVTKYVLDILGMSNVLMETDASGNPQNYYVYGLGLVSRIKPDNSTTYYVYDFRGSTVAMVDATTTANVTHQYQYDDFGNVLQLQEADNNPFRYVGKYGVMYEDSTLQFMRARYYDPTIGRFLSEDPVWSTNLYPYGDNNPITNMDPKGTYSEQFIELLRRGVETYQNVAPQINNVYNASKIAIQSSITELEHLRSSVNADLMLKSLSAAAPAAKAIVPAMKSITTVSAGTVASSALLLGVVVVGAGAGVYHGLIKGDLIQQGEKLLEKTLGRTEFIKKLRHKQRVNYQRKNYIL